MSHPYKSQAQASQQAKIKGYQTGGSVHWPGEHRLRRNEPVDVTEKMLKLGRQSEADFWWQNPDRPGLPVMNATKDIDPGFVRKGPTEDVVPKQAEAATSDYEPGQQYDELMDRSMEKEPPSLPDTGSAIEEEDVKRGGRIKRGRK